MEEKIGVGGFCNVYKAKIKGKNEYRAIKIIDKNLIRRILRDEYLKQNVEEELAHYNKDFRNEVKNMEICQGNNNNNSVKFYEYFDTEDAFIIVMELCDGNMMDLLTRKKNFKIEEIYDFLSQLNNTFKMMYENKICHRDLNLYNILIKYEDKKKMKCIYKLAGFGVSKNYEIYSPRFSSHVGTINFMAPEIINEEKYGYECDMWSLGIIVYTLFFGESPYNAPTEIGILRKIKSFGQKIFLKSGDNDFDKLIKELLVYEPRNRLVWNNYFNHSFFKKRQISNNNIHNNIINYKNDTNNILNNNNSNIDVKNDRLPNEINIILKVGEKNGDKFKNIYFMENNSYRKENEEENKDINNLNDKNTQIFINNQKIKFNKYFVPTKVGLHRIKINFKNKIKDCSYMFRGCENIISIDLSSFDSSEVIDMKQMFSKCYGLKEVNLNNLNVKKVTDISYMFNKCMEIEKIKIPSSFDTQNVENMNFMFNSCEFLKDINFSAFFNTNNVKSMKGMFSKCYKLKQLDLRNFNTGEVKDMSFMFDKCINLEEILINPSTFKTNKTKNMGHMFNECNKLKSFDLSGFNTENVEFFSFMFCGCQHLENLDLTKLVISNEANKTSMFEDCPNYE